MELELVWNQARSNHDAQSYRMILPFAVNGGAKNLPQWRRKVGQVGVSCFDDGIGWSTPARALPMKLAWAGVLLAKQKTAIPPMRRAMAALSS